MLPPIPPLLIATLGFVGAAALVRLIVKERKRVKAELTRQRTQSDNEPPRRLRRDPRTGVYRP